MGLFLNVDPRWDASLSALALSVGADRVQHVGETIHGQKEAAIRLPLFHVETLRTKLNLPLGKFVLLGVRSNRALSGKNAGAYTVVFLHCAERGAKGKVAPAGE